MIEGVSKTYGGFTAVDNVSLSIYKGEMFALVGASGCGKTTLLRMLAGFAQPSSGRILIDGVEMSDVPPHERPVNMMFQSYALFPHMTVESNVGYGLRRLPLDERDAAAARPGSARHGAARARSRKRKPHQLSGGQRQRVALARALIRRPKVLLLDEPLSALDKKLREQTQFELMDLQYQVGITFIVVTHDQDEAMALATRIAVMDRGQVVQVGHAGGDLRVSAQPLRRRLRRHHQSVRGHGERLRAGPDHACSAPRPAASCWSMTSAASRSGSGCGWRCARRRSASASSRRSGARVNQLRGTVWELGYLGNRSTYRIKTASGKLVTVFAQNERRTSEAAIDWSDEVFVSWSADAAVVLQT